MKTADQHTQNEKKTPGQNALDKAVDRNKTIENGCPFDETTTLCQTSEKQELVPRGTTKKPSLYQKIMTRIIAEKYLEQHIQEDFIGTFGNHIALKLRFEFFSMFMSEKLTTICEEFNVDWHTAGGNKDTIIICIPLKIQKS